jgi:hypothetical protein
MSVSLKSEYDADDKLARKVTAINGVDSLTESFTYDNKRRLLNYTASGFKSKMLLPCNENGKPFVSESFVFDGLDNITAIDTCFPNGDMDSATLYTYDNQVKQRVVNISHTLTSGEVSLLSMMLSEI